ncbi:MAG: helix-turn-helix transcriptional regulator [Bacilli bacterium]|nr:helix-turn-helix transcriptional regulator [Bacilli bacterium]
MNTTRELIAAELRGLRAKKDESVEKVANNSSLSKDTITRYENNLVSPTIDNLEKLLNYYGIDFDIFFTNVYAEKHRREG